MKSKFGSVLRRSDVGDYSRILFHDSGNAHPRNPIHMVRKQHAIPMHIKTIEIDVYPYQGYQASQDKWDRIRVGNIRCHSTSIDEGKHLCSDLPEEAAACIVHAAGLNILDAVLNMDLLPHIDFDRGALANNGGFALANALAETPMFIDWDSHNPLYYRSFHEQETAYSVYANAHARDHMFLQQYLVPGLPAAQPYGDGGPIDFFQWGYNCAAKDVPYDAAQNLANLINEKVRAQFRQGYYTVKGQS